MSAKTIVLVVLDIAVLPLSIVHAAVPAQPRPNADSATKTVYFHADVMPVLSKAGCNQTVCHGSAAGKGGFRLSLFGEDPEFDFSALARFAEGRRVNKMEPTKSLFLLKATASIPHGGQKRLEVGSPDYNRLATWIAHGARWRDLETPQLVSIRVDPKERTFKKDETQQLKVTAVFSDGSQKDVTRHALYTLAKGEIASVNDGGQVKAADHGEAVVIVSYMEQRDTAHIVVPQPLPSPFPEAPANNKIDEFVVAKLKKLGIPPSELCSDPEFIRRAYLDVIGTLPTSAEARAFLADPDPQKRAKLIDQLLVREEFVDFWALKWGDLFRIKSGVGVVRPAAGTAYYRWVRESIAQNMPYNQFVREIVTATGSIYEYGAANFFAPASNRDPQSFAEAVALIFMGARIGCARCHSHPVENWTLDDDLGLAAFFATVNFKKTNEWTEEIVYSNPKTILRHPKTGQVVKPKFLGGEVLELDGQEDPRAKFADWLISPQNPWFAKNIVNRIWFWLLGRGIVHEADDWRPTNPPENPELLQYLQEELVNNKYDLKHIFRLILNSRTYQLSSQPNPGNQKDFAHFSHYRVKRLGAEQLLDAVSQVTENWESFRNAVAAPIVTLPLGHRATQIPDGSTESPFLKLFGRAPRDASFESQRDSTPSLRQSLYLVNSDQFQAKVVNSPRIKRLIQEKKSDAEAIEELYFVTLARAPTEKEKQRVLEYMLGESRPAIEQAEAETKAADAALAKVKGDLAKATTDHGAAEKAAKDAEAGVPQAKAAAANAATALANALKAAAAQRQQANDAKKKMDELVQKQQTPAATKLAAAVKVVTDATAAKAVVDKALADSAAATAKAQQAYDAAEKAAKDAEAVAKAVSEDAAKVAEEKKKATEEAAAKRKAADQAKTLLAQVQQTRQATQSKADTAAKALADSAAQKAAAEAALAKVKSDVEAAIKTFQAADQAAKQAETAAANAKAQTDKAQAAQGAAQKAAVEKRKVANEAKTKRDKLTNDEKTTNAQVAEANKKLAAANAAYQRRRLPALHDVLWVLLNTKDFTCNH